MGAEAWTSSRKGRESPWAMVGGGLPCPLTGFRLGSPLGSLSFSFLAFRLVFLKENSSRNSRKSCFQVK